MSFADRAGLAAEIEHSLCCGRAFLREPTAIPVLSDCVLVLVHPEHGAELRLCAQVVMVNDHGTGLALTPLSQAQLADLSAFASALPPPAAASEAPVGPAQLQVGTQDALAPEPEAVSTHATPSATDGVIGQAAPPCSEETQGPDTALHEALGHEALGHEALGHEALGHEALGHEALGHEALGHEAPGHEAPGHEALGHEALGHESLAQEQPRHEVLAHEGLEQEQPRREGTEQPGEQQDTAQASDFPRSQEQELPYDGVEPPAASSSKKPSRSNELQTENRQERLRRLSPAEQLKVARRGELADRLAVERLYGKQVWEALLQNPRLTVPEVAKIARKGTVPKPLLEVILDNAAWTKADAVRRALLGNPKVGPDAVLKLLRLTPKHELKLIEKGSAYGAAVREAARKLLRQ